MDNKTKELTKTGPQQGNFYVTEDIYTKGKVSGVVCRLREGQEETGEGRVDPWGGGCH